MAAIILLVSGACSDPRAEELEQRSKAAADMAVQCMRDAETVPAQHSMHCIEAAKMLHTAYSVGDEGTLEHHCFQSEGKACEEHFDTLARVNIIYWKAIALSAASFGVPEDQDGRESMIHFYQNPVVMEPHFAECLKKHPDPPLPEPVKRPELDPGEIPVAEDPGIIEENKHCIGLGSHQPPPYP